MWLPHAHRSDCEYRCSVYLYTCVLCCNSNSKNEHDCWWVFKPAAYNRALYECRLSGVKVQRRITGPAPWSGTPDLSLLDRAVNQMAELININKIVVFCAHPTSLPHSWLSLAHHTSFSLKHEQEHPSACLQGKGRETPPPKWASLHRREGEKEESLSETYFAHINLVFLQTYPGMPGLPITYVCDAPVMLESVGVHVVKSVLLHNIAPITCSRHEPIVPLRVPDPMRTNQRADSSASVWWWRRHKRSFRQWLNWRAA